MWLKNICRSPCTTCPGMDAALSSTNKAFSISDSDALTSPGPYIILAPPFPAEMELKLSCVSQDAPRSIPDSWVKFFVPSLWSMVRRHARKRARGKARCLLTVQTVFYRYFTNPKYWTQILSEQKQDPRTFQSAYVPFQKALKRKDVTKAVSPSGYKSMLKYF